MKITIPSRRLAITILLVVLVVSALLALLLFSDKGYPATSKWKTYSNSKLSFSYPSSWKFQPCNPKEGREITLPGTIVGEFETDHESLIILGFFDGYCEGHDLNPKIYHERMKNPDPRCEASQGKKLKNGLYLQAGDRDDPYVTSVYVHQHHCMTVYGESIVEFQIHDPEKSTSATNVIKYAGEPRVEKVDFLASQQYKDIKKFAESIVLK